MDDKKTLNRDENIFMQDVMILRNDLVKYSEAVKKRLSPFPGAWRDLRLMLYLVRKLQAQLLDTIPDRKIEQLQQMALHGQFFIEMPGPLKKNRYVILAEGDLSVLMQAAMANECVMCMKEGREIKRCPLRSALMNVTPPEKIIKDPKAFGCEYQETGCAISRGEYVEM